MSSELDAIDEADRQRDARRRRCVLRRLQMARISPMGGLHGNRLLEVLDAALLPSDRLGRDADGLLRMARYLVDAGYITEADARKRKSQPYAIEYRFFALTALGEKLLCEAIGPDPMIDDDRLPEGN